MATFGLFIGINQYVDKAFTALTCPEEDASELYSLFKRDLGLGANAHKLVGQPSTLDVKRRLRSIGQQIRNGDSFIFFFAGHGYQHPEKKDQYLLFPEAESVLLRRGKIDGELLSLSSLVALTDDWEGVQRAIILDACRSWLPVRGAMPETFQNEAALAYVTRRDPGLRKRDAGHAANEAEEESALAMPPLIVNACRDGEAAYELEADGRGVLSLALERRILRRREAEMPVWLGNELMEEVKDEMQALLHDAQIGARQRPFIMPEDAKVLLYKPRLAANDGAAERARQAEMQKAQEVHAEQTRLQQEREKAAIQLANAAIAEAEQKAEVARLTLERDLQLTKERLAEQATRATQQEAELAKHAARESKRARDETRWKDACQGNNVSALRAALLALETDTYKLDLEARLIQAAHKEQAKNSEEANTVEDNACIEAESVATTDSAPCLSEEPQPTMENGADNLCIAITGAEQAMPCAPQPLSTVIEHPAIDHFADTTGTESIAVTHSFANDSYTPLQVYSPMQAAWGALLGGPWAALYFISANFVSLQQFSRVRYALYFGAFLYAALIFALRYFIPADFDPYEKPYVSLAIGSFYSALTYFFVRKIQLNKFSYNENFKYTRKSSIKAFLLSIFWLAIFYLATWPAEIYLVNQFILPY